MNPPETSKNDARPTVLLVDDSRVMRKAISKILADEFDLVEADHGEAGWEQLTSHPEISVVISDIEMPKLDGYELMTRIRNFEDIHIRNMPVIIITGAEDEETRQTALDLGATDFITKPVDRTQLLARTRAQVKYTATTRSLEETETTLQTETTQDPLTGLRSRRYFLQRGEQDIAYCIRHNQDMALLRIDIDKFRRLYSEYGDETVDDVLIWVAESLSQTARTEDTLARIGGSSFAIMAPATNPGEAMILGDRIRTALSKRPFKKSNILIPMTASIGLATLSSHQGSDINALLNIAHENLRKARRGGGDAIQADDETSDLEFPAAVLEGSAFALPEDGDIEPVENAVNNIDFSASEELILDSEVAPIEDQPVPELDKAMASLDSGVLSELEPHLWALLKRLLPMLEYCDEKLNLGIGAATKVIRHKIENPEEE